MYFKLICVLVTVSIVVNDFGTVTAQEEMSCKQILSSLMKRQLGGITKCTKSMKFKSGKEKADKMTCILKCVMQNEGLLNEEGKLTKEQFDIFVKKELPPSMQERGIPLLENCRATTSEALDPKEEKCKSYDPLIKCFLGAVTQLCPS